MTDTELILLVSRGDEQAFKQLFMQYRGIVIHIIAPLVKNEHDREELVQDVFIKVFYKIKTFKGDSKLSTWIGKIAYHHCLNYFRRKRIATEFLDNEMADGHYIDVPDEQGITDADEIYSAIAHLPEIHQIMIRLFHIDQLNYQEIGTVLSISSGTVKSRLFRARMALKDYLLNKKSKNEKY